MTTDGEQLIRELIQTPDATNTWDLGSAVREYRTLYTRNTEITTNLKLADGTEGDGYMLMSDASGNASWMTGRLCDIYWENNTSSTDITTTGVFVKASVDASATILNTNRLGSWDLNGVENRLRYTGARSGFAHIGCTLSVTGGNGQVYECYIGKNGTKIAGSLIELSTSNATSETSSAIHCMDVIAQNDYLELYITNTTSTNNDPIVKHCNLFAMIQG